MKKLTGLTVALALALTVGGCAAEGTPAPEESAEVASPDAATEAASAADDDSQRGRGQWPEGYSFALPAGLTLQDEILDPLKEGDMFTESPPYRRLTVSEDSPLLSPPPALTDGAADESVVGDGMAFGARFFVERVLDSELLMREYTREAEQEWFNAVAVTDELQEDINGLADLPINSDDHAFALSLGAPLFRSGGWDDSDDEDSDDSQSDTVGVTGVLYEEDGPRLANVQATLASAELTGDYLELTYEGTARMLLQGAETDEEPGKVYGVDIEADLTLGLGYDGDQWKLVTMNSTLGYERDDSIS